MELQLHKDSYYFIDRDSNFAYQGIQALGEVTTVVLLSTVGGAVTIISNIASAVLKGAGAFIPGQFYQEKISSPFKEFTLAVTIKTLQAWTRIGTSFAGEKMIKQVDQKVVDWLSPTKALEEIDPVPEVTIDIPEKPQEEPTPSWQAKGYFAALAGGIALLSLARFGALPTAKALLIGVSLGGGGIMLHRGVEDVRKGEKKEGSLKIAGATALFASALMVYAYFPTAIESLPERDKHIVFGTTYLNGGNPTRNAVSELSVKNHEVYSKEWGLEHHAELENLLEGECTNPISNKSEECVPYWNKIKMLKNWLEEPKVFPDKEEWRIYLDDDMPVTNMKINPYKAIDQLREGKDSSMIIATDIQPWDKGNVYTSVNTGVLIARKDQAALDLITSVWEKRNTIFDLEDPECPTYGLCKQQKVFHEQQAFSDVLHEISPSLKKTISVVLPRDSWSVQRRQIALNTMFRKGCFEKKGHPYAINYYEDDSKNPDGIWQRGDWMAQVSGVPIMGNYCWEDQERPLRKELLEKLLTNVVHSWSTRLGGK